MVKIRQLLDEVFAFYIKCRDAWKCRICCGEFEVGAELLDCSHFYPRRNSGVRWHESNCDALCRWCHKKFEHAKEGTYKRFKLRQLGETELEELRQLSVLVIKFNDQDKLEMIGKFLGKIEELGYEVSKFRKKLLMLSEES